MPDGYRINTLVAVFNICDTIGRYLPNYIPNSKFQVTIFVFLRSLFIISFPLLILLQRTYEVVN